MLKITRYGYRWFVYNLPLKVSSLPQEDGVYLFRIKNENSRNYDILYIGQTGNFRQRMFSHKLNKKTTNTELLFYKTNGDEYKRRLTEAKLIRTFVPKGNCIKQESRNSNMYKKRHPNYIIQYGKIM